MGGSGREWEGGREKGNRELDVWVQDQVEGGRREGGKRREGAGVKV